MTAVGLPREIKQDERRVGLTPPAVAQLVQAGHRVFVERRAGVGSGYWDEEFAAAGAELVDARDAWAQADMVVKVKEPTPDEYTHFREGLLLFTYLHLAANPELTDALMSAGVTAAGYETLEDAAGKLPLLAPMSAIAGRLAVQEAAHFLLASGGGSGVMLGPVAGVAPRRVVVIGGGTVGYHAAVVALGLGARTTLFDVRLERLAELEQTMAGRIELEAAARDRVAGAVEEADVVIGAVLVPGARAPSVVDRSMIEQMAPGSVVCDVAIDQGGCIDTSRPTTHSAPVFECEDVLHYCVTNMPGAVPATATRALVNATLPFVQAFVEAIADGVDVEDLGDELGSALNVLDGRIVQPAVADAYVMAGRSENANHLEVR
jgi:alanine dehydrogenase